MHHKLSVKPSCHKFEGNEIERKKNLHKNRKILGKSFLKANFQSKNIIITFCVSFKGIDFRNDLLPAIIYHSV